MNDQPDFRFPAGNVHRFPWSVEECNRRAQAAAEHVAFTRNSPDIGVEWHCEAATMMSAWHQLYLAKKAAREKNWRGVDLWLRNLQPLISNEDFRLGRMPDFLPEYRFRPREAHER